MKKIITPSFWISTLLTTMFTCFCIYLLKKAAAKVDVPVVSDIIQEV